MRAEDFVKADEQIEFMKFVLDSTWTQIKKRRAKELKRKEGRKSAELASKRASVVKRNKNDRSSSSTTQTSALRPQR